MTGKILLHKSQSLRWPYALLGILYLGNMLAFWPGIVSPDAASQYAAAVAGIYSDHHPPIMSFVWRYLDKIYPGPGLLFCMHISMLYSAAAVFMLCFRNSLFKWWFVIFPLIPNILSYTPLIVKDVGFAYAYLLSAALISYLMVFKVTKYKYWIISAALILLFYGTAAKFQARYLLIYFTLGVAFCWQYKFSWRAVLAGVILYLAIIFSMFGLHTWLVPAAQEANSWQLVKLFDLSAISIDHNKEMFPDFVKKNPDYSFERVKKLFSPTEVDPLVFAANKVLKSGETEAERTELNKYWRNTVMKHPLSYLHHRARLWVHNLYSTPSERTHPADYFKHTIIGAWMMQPSVHETIGVVYAATNILLQFIWLLPVLVFYTVLSFVKINKTTYAIPLLMFSLASFMLLGVLFFCSMASTARYVFMCVCLLHASHGFADKCWRAK